MAKLMINKEIARETSGSKFLGKMRLLSDIKTNPELEKRFIIDQKVLDSIIKSIKCSGYDASEPIIIWKETGEIVDGHTRYKAAKEAGIDEVPVVDKSFENLEEAKKYTEHRQFDRRNLTQAEIYEYAVNLEESSKGEGRATEKLAEKLGVSASTLQHARTVNKKADNEVKEKLKKNEITVNQAYSTVRESKKKEDPISDNSGNPSGLNFNHSDGIERPHYPPYGEEEYLNKNTDENDEEESDLDSFSDIEDSMSEVTDETNYNSCLFDEIQNYNVKQLAKYLSKIQRESIDSQEALTEEDWEQKLTENI